MKNSYSSPPLVEVAISLKFEPIQSCPEAHYGAFWAKVRDDFPKVRSVAPIPSIEDDNADEQWSPTLLKVSFSQDPSSRIQMVSPNDEWVCQLQDDRLIVNWRKRTQEYPRYSTVHDALMKRLEQWRDFCSEYNLPSGNVSKWEITYLNIIDLSQESDQASALHSMFPTFAPPNAAYATIRGLTISQHLIKNNVRLAIELKPNSHEKNKYVLSITTRGNIIANDVDQSLEAGHDLVILCFESIISDEARKAWKIKQ